MTPEQLTQRLAASSAEGAGPSPSCPDEHVIAGYVDGGLAAQAAAQLERHLADCSHCLGLVALLVGERGAAHAASSTLADTRAASTGARKKPEVLGGVQKWAAAAALLLAAPVIFQLGRNADRGDEGQGRPPDTTTRMVASVGGMLQVLSPGPGSAVDPSRLVFSWTEVPGSPYYDLRIVTDEGDVVVEQRVSTTSWQSSTPLGLKRGAEYFVLVEAYPSGDKALSSRHVPFRIPE
jgi:hypothetical protein